MRFVEVIDNASSNDLEWIIKEVTASTLNQIAKIENDDPDDFVGDLLDDNDII